MLKIFKTFVKKIVYTLLGLFGTLKSSTNKNLFHDIYIIGDLYSESGLGNIMRSLIQSFGDDYSCKLINLPLSVGSHQGSYKFSKQVVKKIGPGISIFVGNPSILAQALMKLNTFYLISNYTIGVWFWELGNAPQDWITAGRLVDEVWAQSDFAADAFFFVAMVVKTPLILLYETSMPHLENKLKHYCLL